MKTKKFFSHSIAFLLSFCLFTVSASVHGISEINASAEESAVTSGTCGIANRTTWTFENETLTLSTVGSDGMDFPERDDDVSSDDLPWAMWNDQIKTIDLCKADLTVYDSFFEDFKNVETVRVSSKSLDTQWGGYPNRKTSYDDMIENADVIFAPRYSYTEWLVHWDDTKTYIPNGTATAPFYTESGQIEDSVSWYCDTLNRTLHIYSNYETGIVSNDAVNQIVKLSKSYDTIYFESKQLRISPSNLMVLLDADAYAGEKTDKMLYLYSSLFEGESPYFGVSWMDDLSIIDCTYVLLDDENTDFICGDITRDGRVDTCDAVRLSQMIARDQLTITPDLLHIADCNGDQIIDSNDVLLLLQFLVHIVDSLPLNS